MGRNAVVLAGLFISAVLLHTSSNAAQSRQTAFDVAEASIADLQEAMTSGRITSKQIVQQYLDRIEVFDKHGPKLNAILSLNPDALKDAEALDRERSTKGSRGPLHGVPIVVKDNYDVAGMATTAGSISLADHVVKNDAFQVQKLREAGAVILGKTNLHEFASGYLSVSSLGGQTRNPYDPSRNPGGSSGGTAAAVAASLAAVGMGTDTCGSIREPSALNNLVGLRPTKGLSSISGILPLSTSVDTAGPLARSVADLAAVLDATIGEDPDDSATHVSSLRPRFRDYLNPQSLDGKRIGIINTPVTGGAFIAPTATPSASPPPGFGHSQEDQEVGGIVNGAVKELQKLGVTTVDVTFTSDLLEQLRAAGGSSAFEFQEDFNKYLATAPSAARSLADIVKQGGYTTSLDAALKARLAGGRNQPGYQAWLPQRKLVSAQIEQLMKENRVDALLYPTVTRKAAIIGEPQAGTGNCSFAPATGFPAISIPVGFTQDGLPVGMELMGRAFDDARLVGFAFAYEQATHHRRAPDLTPPLHGQRSIPLLSWKVSDKSASGNFDFDASTNELHYSLKVMGTPQIAAATLRQAAVGESGPVVSLLGRNSGPGLSGVEILSSQSRAALVNGKLYVDITTHDKPTSGYRLQLSAPKP